MGKKNNTDLELLLQEILTDACTDEEQIRAILQYIEAQLVFPVDGFVVGEPVSVLEIYYFGNIRQGLMASCRMENGAHYKIAAADIVFPSETRESKAMAVYRCWLGLDPFTESSSVQNSETRHKVKGKDIDMGKPVELIVVSVKEKSCRCLTLDTKRSITLRTRSLDQTAPGWIITVDPGKQWYFSGHSYLSGKIIGNYLDAVKLGLQPLGLEDCGQWDPAVEYWRDEEAPLDTWMQAIIAWGERPQYVMEQVLPGVDFGDPFSDPIFKANELSQAGEIVEARQLFMQLLESDMRCLDAYAHLGNMEFDSFPGAAIKFFEAGVRIGELSLGKNFIGLLPWGMIDNRPFLRCLSGYGLCLWRLSEFEEAAVIFNRMLWLNPTDNQGLRFGLERVESRLPWSLD